MVQNYSTILAVINEKRAIIDPAGLEAYCDTHLDKLYKGEFKKYSWRRHTTTVR